MPKWVRCRDRDTGHEYDLSPNDLRVRDGRVEVLEDYPPNQTDRPRRAKHRIDKAGRPRRPAKKTKGVIPHGAAS